MNRRRSMGNRILVVLLLLICLLGGWLLMLQRDHPGLFVRRLSLEDTVQTTQDPLSSANSAQPAARPKPPPPESRFAVIALRPLFIPGRRPADQPATSEPVSRPKAAPAVVLTGIVRVGNDSRAIVEPARPGARPEPSLMLRVGDTLDGWQVEAIGVDRLVLIQGDERLELELKVDSKRRRQQQPGRDRKKTRPQQNPQPPPIVQPTQPESTQ